jgi:hypothetical protein
VVKLPTDQLIANVAEVLWIHFDEVMLPVAVAGLTLSKTIAADIVITSVAFLTVGISAADGLVADVAVKVDLHVGIFREVGKVLGIATVALLCLTTIYGNDVRSLQRWKVDGLTNSILDKIAGHATCDKTTSGSKKGLRRRLSVLLW